MNHIVTFRDYLRDRFGERMQRIPFDAGLSCPHRAKDGSGGCAFCPADGSRARHLQPGMSLAEQLERGREYVRTRYGSEGPYIAYFQAFTATNADACTLRGLYFSVLDRADFKMVVIATRPDCLPPETLDLIGEISKKYETWVELGVQTANDDTLDFIHRGHHFDAVEKACTDLAERGIRVAAHIILGLPGETEEDYIRTARKIAKLPFSAVKMHNLLVLRGTKMEKMLSNGLVSPMGEYEYANALSKFLRELPEGWIVMRFCSDAGSESIVAPKWWMDKTAFTDMFLRMYESGEISPDCMKAVMTGDGSYTFYHPKYHQHFHSVAGAWKESNEKYLLPCRVADRLKTGKSASILDVGFGMGFNVCSAVELAESMAGEQKLYITTLESDPSALSAALRLPERRGENIVRSLVENGHYDSKHASVDLLLGDARDSVVYLYTHFDFVFLDGFTPVTNPELWTADFLREIKSLLKDDGLVASYSAAYPFRGALLENGFLLYESTPFGRRRGGTVASLCEMPFLPPLAEKDMLIALKSTAGIPYRDPGLRNSREDILARRVAEVAEKRASGMPKWYRPGC